jgi:predicted PhzF superfamily epimerase YddE/YHI9
MEDPATGSASCGLSALLAMKLKLGKNTTFEITQAVEMGRQSDIGVVITLKDSMDAVESMELSGSSVKVMEGTVEYD